MEPNPILTEIRATREELARKSGYDVGKFMDFIRERERESARRGVTFAPVAGLGTKVKKADELLPSGERDHRKLGSPARPPLDSESSLVREDPADTPSQ
ncbi:MAG TPA: hypothetical protein VGO11_03215 [Chthoniobacteraceae bacterium]|jgi:hypothetical protein|nr:hypothetical protein [Chthoniobacteraceae bacterium]